MKPRLIIALLAAAALIACESINGPTRKASSGLCDSDKDCLYGLVCRGAPVGVAGERKCVHEQYSRCKTVRDCLPGRACHEHFCQVQCVVDADCLQLAAADGGELATVADGGSKIAPEDYKCVVGECRTGSAERQCLAASDCTPDQDCVASRCVTRMNDRCVNDFDCPSGERCVGGVCR